ncbi:AAA family ATPase [Collinsella sp. AGMB00827]|uniref:AAA family ATPase n=1 Tax=Collinsella ureilytica TaxID=2869515 RepID=A0ABS7MK23_9ACTN|nr:ATP-binding protein [Collinsella urealyticum]MBY4796760.1 AAA family ATPase [Collinsella urealyticum]
MTEMDENKSPVKIASLELENVKRVRALSLEPAPDGLTVIGGRNGQGKTSVLDAIAYALGGERKRPDKPTREGSATPAAMRVELTNGLVVERSGKNCSLKVTDPEGRRAGQALINGLIEELALDLPKFMAMSDREKAGELLRIIGVGEELEALDRELSKKSDIRLAVGQQKRAKRKVAEDAPWFADAPAEPVSATELIAEQSAILARNGERQRLRAKADELASELILAEQRLAATGERIRELTERAATEAAEVKRLQTDVADAKKTAGEIQEESTAEVEEKLAEIDAINERVRANQRRAQMEADADALDEEYRALDEEVAAIRDRRAALLEGAGMPLPGLTVEDGKLVYNGAVWGDMSGSEQLRVATAVVRALKPSCGFVLVDELEKMDPATLAEFGAWAQEQDLQVIGTRVATDGTCTVVIEDGRVVGANVIPAPGTDIPEAASAPEVSVPEALAPETPLPEIPAVPKDLLDGSFNAPAEPAKTFTEGVF